MAFPPEEIPGKLTSLEDPEESMEQTAGPTGEEAKESAGYTGADQRCASCEYFDGAAKCNKFQFSAEPDGHCTSWEAGGETPAYEAEGEEDEAFLPELQELE